MENKIRAAYQEKEKAELFLANLESLHVNKSINDSSYSALKSEYSVNLRKALALIEQLKREVDKKLQARARQLAVYKQELAHLDARHKVGQISADAYFRTARAPDKKIALLERTVAQLSSLMAASHSSEISVPQGNGLASIFSRKARTASQPAAFAAMPAPVTPAGPAEPMPLPAREMQVADNTVISSLAIMPQRVQPGNTVGVIATIINAGNQAVTHRAEFKVNNILESVSEIKLEAGQNTELTFMTIAGPPGDYTVSVDGANGLLKVIPFAY